MSLIVDKKYINLVSPMLEMFKWKGDTLANCRCPICGDSKSNKTKARGYFYSKNNDMFYRCHNCGASTSIYRFLETVSPALSKQYSLERWKGGENGHSNYEKPKIKMDTPKFNKIVLPTINDLDRSHVCKSYVTRRKIPQEHWENLYYAENFAEFVNKHIQKDVGEEPRLIIPIFDKDNELVGFQGRALDDNAIRYVTIKFDEDTKLCFGVERANLKSVVYVMEGPIDSLFIPNSVAILGMNHEIDANLFASSKLIYVLDNEPRNKHVVQQYQKLINTGKTVCIWPNSVTGKDVNDMVLRGRTPIEVKRVIDTNTYSGPEALIRFSQWKKV
jgi:hypothetical protein